MARKPIHIEMRGTLTPAERIWQVIRTLREGFTTTAVQDAIKPAVPSFDAVQDYMRRLELAGYIHRRAHQTHDARAKFTSLVFDLVNDALEAPRIDDKGNPVKQGSVNEAMWRAMRALKQFDYETLAAHATLGTTRVTRYTAQSYVLALHKAGYLCANGQVRSGARSMFRLVRDTGPYAPAITRRKCVFDRNTGEFAWQQTAQEVVDDCNPL